jgi:hypothetical protein
MGMQLAKVRSGQKSDTGMTEAQIDDFAKKPKKGYPKKSGSLPTHGSGELSPIGQRVVAGYHDRFGPAEGHKKFEAAVAEGRVDKAKMFKRKATGKFSSRTV